MESSYFSRLQSVRPIRDIFFIASCLLVFSTCSKDRHASWDFDALAPLAETSLSLEDIIPDSILQSTSGSPLLCRFSKTLSLFPADSVFRIPDTTISATYSLPIPVNLPANFQLYNINDLIRFDFGNTRITEAILEDGLSVLTLNNYIREKLIFDYSIRKATLDGSSLNYSGIQVDSALANNHSTVSRTTRFKGYRLDLTGDNDNQFNRLRIKLNAKLNPEGLGVAVPGNQTLISYSSSFIGLKPYFAKGYLGNPLFESQDSIDFNFLKKFEGHFEPEQVTLNMIVENGIGADFGFDLLELSAFNRKTGINKSLENAIVSNRQYVSRAKNIPQNQLPYTAGKTSFSISTSNSNLGNLISILPDKFYYHARIQLNPLGDISSGNDFIYSSSNIIVKIEAEIPIKVKANSLRFTDTLEVGQLDVDQLDQVRSGTFRLIAENGFPFEMQAEIVLLDDKKQFIRSFLADDTIQSAPVNQEMIVTGPVTSILEVPYQALLRDQLRNTKYIVLKAKVTTVPENEFLPVYPGYKLKLKLIGDGIYRIQIR